VLVALDEHGLNAAMTLQIVKEDDESAAVHAAIRQGIRANDPPEVGPRNYQPLFFSLRDAAGTIVGGIYGATIWGWLLIEGLWVAPEQRGRGHGGRLLAAAEALAIDRGCKSARLGTFDFQARAFYERHGYGVFGELAGFPEGHRHFELSKRLETQDSDAREPR
jgi:GNAT superfamily N-acetyltransferase